MKKRFLISTLALISILSACTQENAPKETDPIIKENSNVEQNEGVDTSLTPVIDFSEMNGTKEEPSKEKFSKVDADGNTIFKAFDFKAATLESYDKMVNFYKEGKDISLATEYKTLEDYKGKNLMIVFYVSWCVHCHNQIPQVLEFMKENEKKDDFEVIFINMVDREEYLESARLSTTYFNIPSEKVLVDIGSYSSKSYDVNGTPTNVFITKEEEIFHFNEGEISKEDMQFILDEMYKK